MIKRFIFTLLAVVASAVAFISPIKSNSMVASAETTKIFNTYTYETDTTCGEYYGSLSNAISSVESVKFDYKLWFEYTIHCKQDTHFYFLVGGISSFASGCASDVVFSLKSNLMSAVPTNVNILFHNLTRDSNTMHLTTMAYTVSNNGWYVADLKLWAGCDYKISFFMPYAISQTFDTDLSALVDMDSNTNFNLIDLVANKALYANINSNFYQSVTYSATGSSWQAESDLLQSLANISPLDNNNGSNVARIPQGVYFKNASSVFDVNSFQKFYELNQSVGNSWLINRSADLWLTAINMADFKGCASAYLSNTAETTATVTAYERKAVVENLEILINMPTYRTQNSLILYNYDYASTLSSVTKVKYRLLRDYNYYDVVYSGSIPNYKTIVIDNKNTNNITYSNYIYLNITCNSLPVSNAGKVNFGFDFNFGNFVEPFPTISTDSSTSKFDRPALPTDLTPRLSVVKTDTVPWFKLDFHFPVINWIKYGFLWVLFYAPVIGDCTAFLYTFFGKFVSIFNVFISLPIGTFLVAFVTFMLCFKLFTYFVPFINNTVGVTIKNISYNSNRKRLDNKNFEDKVARQNVKKKVFKRESKKIIKKSFKEFDKQNKI